MDRSPFQDIALRAGMPREEAEKLIAAALKRESTYVPYGTNLDGGTVVYDDPNGRTRLEVVYDRGVPAPWEVQPDGTAIHRAPIDESVKSFRILGR